MAMPFKVFDYTVSSYRMDHVWCVRCEDWIPTERVDHRLGYAYLHPHIYDHLQAWQALREVKLNGTNKAQRMDAGNGEGLRQDSRQPT